MMPAASPWSSSSTAFIPTGSLTVRTTPSAIPCRTSPGMRAHALWPLTPTASARPDAARTRNPRASGQRPPIRSNRRPASGPARMMGIVPGMSARPGRDRPDPDDQQQVVGQEVPEPQLHHAREDLADDRREEVRPAEERELDERHASATIDDDERHEEGHRRDQAAHDLETVPPDRLPLGQTEDQEHHEPGEAAAADIADAAPGGRVRDQRRGTQQREDDGADRQRHVDEEHQPPARRGEQTSENRPDRREERGKSREQAEREPASFLWPDRTGDRDRRRHHHRSRQALHDPSGQQPGHAQRQPGRHRGEGEDDGSGEERPLQPEPVTQPSTEDQERRQRQDVRGQDPLAERQRAVKVVHDLGDRHRHRGLVDQDHAAGQCHRGQCQPQLPRRVPRTDHEPLLNVSVGAPPRCSSTYPVFEPCRFSSTRQGCTHGATSTTGRSQVLPARPRTGTIGRCAATRSRCGGTARRFRT